MPHFHNQTCFNNHMGVWLCESRFMSSVLHEIQSGLRKPVERVNSDLPPVAAFVINATPVSFNGIFSYWMSGDVAIISLDGPLMKAESKYGGTSTVAARKAIRAAVDDPRVGAIMLHIDSPGGHVSGTMELAADVKAASKIKPTAAHADDLIASAAYWVGSSANRVTINRAGQAGSIGTVAVVHDISAAAEAEGVKVHVVSTGPDKGAFTPGAPVTDENLAYLRELVDSSNALFQESVKENRKLDSAKMAKVSSGRVFSATESVALGLVDAIMSFEMAIADLAKQSTAKTTGNQRRERAALALDFDTMN